MKVKWRPIIRAGIGPHCLPLQYTDVVLPEVERVEHYAHVNLVSGYLRGFAVGRQRGFEAGQRAALAAYLCGASERAHDVSQRGVGHWSEDKVGGFICEDGSLLNIRSDVDAVVFEDAQGEREIRLVPLGIMRKLLATVAGGRSE